MVDVLYSLMDINERFDHLILDLLYIRNLDMAIKSCFNRIFSIDEQIHERISGAARAGESEEKIYLLLRNLIIAFSEFLKKIFCNIGGN